ncbi:hypothetical protein H2200_003001 [Cladophialophora chaetospira]|uniref:Uncharacterized protein n=1 Tax=Cladophialophora chaetospira TaxID=386627 RepID=A0AA38XGI5_9EURO|nr:hypothetical protein H2200_003001 [Cladophialophora chaetospira]
MRFSSILCPSAAIASAFAAPQGTTSTFPTTSSAISTTTSTVPSSTSSSPPTCTSGQHFFIKVRSLEGESQDYRNGAWLVDSFGIAVLDRTVPTPYRIIDTFITESDTGKIATVKTTTEGAPHVGDIVIVKPEDSIRNKWSPLRCTGITNGTLNCTTSAGNVLQMCGNKVGVGPTKTANCQDQIALDVVCW